MSHLFIIRGLPGAGKSTLAKSLVNYEAGDGWFEADFFMEQYCGKGGFDPAYLGEAHRRCFEAVDWTLNQGFDCIVSNTFTTEKELQPYIDYCHRNDHTFSSIIVENRHGNKSVHNVPDETMIKMKNRFSIKLYENQMLTQNDIDIMYAEKPAGDFKVGEHAEILGDSYVCEGPFGVHNYYITFQFNGVRVIYNKFAKVKYLKHA